MWPLVEADLQDIGIDVESGILKQRSGRWLRVKLIGLLYTQSRIARVYQAREEEVRGDHNR